MSEINIGTIRVKQGLAQMLKGGVIVSKSQRNYMFSIFICDII